MAFVGTALHRCGLMAVLAAAALVVPAGCERDDARREAGPRLTAAGPPQAGVLGGPEPSARTEVPVAAGLPAFEEILSLADLPAGQVRVIGAAVPEVLYRAVRPPVWGAGRVHPSPEPVVGPTGVLYIRAVRQRTPPQHPTDEIGPWECVAGVISPEGELLHQLVYGCPLRTGADLVAGPDGECYVPEGEYVFATSLDAKTLLVYPCPEAETGQHLALQGKVLVVGAGGAVVAWPAAGSFIPSGTAPIGGERHPRIVANGRSSWGGRPEDQPCARPGDALWALELSEGETVRSVRCSSDARTTYVLVDSADGLALLTVAGGEPQGRVPLSGAGAWVAVGPDGCAYIADAVGVHVVDGGGQEIATSPLEGVLGPPVAVGDRAVVVSCEGSVVCLEVGGEERWSAPLSSEAGLPGAAAVLGDGSVCVAGSRAVLAFDAGGTLSWVYPYTHDPRATAEAGRAFVVLAPDGTLVVVSPSGLYARLGESPPATATAAALQTPSLDDPWPQMGRDPGRTGLSPVRGPRAPRFVNRRSLAEAELPDPFGSTLMVGAGPVLGRDGARYGALFPNAAGLFGLPPDGPPWATSVGSHGVWWPLLRPDGALWLAGEGQTFLIDPSGLIRRQIDHARATACPVMDASGALYRVVGSHGQDSRSLVRIDLQAGVTALAEFRVNMTSDWGPAIGRDGVLYLGGLLRSSRETQQAERGRLWAVSPRGSTLWEARLNSCSCPTWIAVAPDGAVVVTSGFGVHRFTPGGVEMPADHDVATSQLLGGPAAIGPDGTCYVAQGGIAAVAPGGGLRWVADLGRRTGEYAPPAVDADGVVYTVSDRMVWAIGPDGVVLWAASLGDGGNFGDGQVRWPALDAEGKLHICGREGEQWVLADP